MQVIINAADFGFDSDTDDATMRSFNRGMLTSASIMANMPNTEEALKFASAHPEFSFGVHLTYTLTVNEQPLSDASLIPSLMEKDGRFMKANKLRLAALVGRVSVADIIRETRAQISRLRDYGISVSHVDSHCHLHKFHKFQEALRQILPTFGIRRVRLLQNIYTRTPMLRPTFWITYGSNARLRQCFATTDYMFMPDPSGDSDWPDRLQRKLVGEGTLEVGVHPGRSDEWRHRETICAEQFVAHCTASKSKLITWRGIK